MSPLALFGISVLTSLFGMLFSVLFCNAVENNSGTWMFIHGTIAAFLMMGAVNADRDVAEWFIAFTVLVLAVFSAVMAFKPSGAQRSA